MRLVDLNPKFERIEQERGWTVYKTVGLADAHGVSFLCPACFKANGGPVGTHTIICWSRTRGAPDNEAPLPGRWSMSGRDATDLSLFGEGSTDSIQMLHGCKAHFYIKRGAIIFT